MLAKLNIEVRIAVETLQLASDRLTRLGSSVEFIDLDIIV
jgi:hypothetical protein